MSQNYYYYATPMSSKPFLNNSKGMFHDFVRPSCQSAVKYGNSPFKGSPKSEDLDFIPLSYSSPVTNTNRRGGGGNWKANYRENLSLSSSSCNSSFSSPVTNANRRGGGGNWKANYRKNLSLSNSSCNSSLSPYSMNKKHFNRSFTSSNGNSSFSPYNNMDRPRSYSSNRNRRDNNFLGNKRNSDDIRLYYHPSMLEDPWAELEQKLRNHTSDQNCSLDGKHAREKSTLNLRSVDSLVSVSDSDEGADSQGTDSSSLLSDGS